MPRRSFDDSFWGDSFVQELSKDAKLLFAYLWTNKRCNSAGLYEITLKTISFETGIDIETLPDILNDISLKVKWQHDENIIWVKNFLKHQPKSPQFLKSVADCLSRIASNGIVKEFIDYYSHLGVSIPYQYGMDIVSNRYRYKLEPELEPDKEQELDNIIKVDKKISTETGDKIKRVFESIDKLRGYRPPKRKAEAASIIRMLKKYTPEQIIETWEILKGDNFWHDKELFMMTIESQIGAILNNGTYKPSSKQGKANSNEDRSDKYTGGKYGKFIKS